MPQLTWQGHLLIQGDKYSMIRKRLKPVAIDGITFDAMLNEQKNYNATIPQYPVESGFPISDTIILEPLSIQLTLYISNTPVTFLYRHSNSMDRVKKICEQIEKLWLSKKLVKIVTPDTIYTDMGLTSISIKKSKELGYAREISITAVKVRITNTKTASIPDYILKSGKSMANAGKADTTTSSQKKASSDGDEAGSTGATNSDLGIGGSSSGSNESKQKKDSKKGKSVLYGLAGGLFKKK